MREILKEKYKIDLECQEWCAMQTKTFLELHINTYQHMSNFLITVPRFGNVHVCNQISSLKWKLISFPECYT